MERSYQISPYQISFFGFFQHRLRSSDNLASHFFLNLTNPMFGEHLFTLNLVLGHLDTLKHELPSTLKHLDTSKKNIKIFLRCTINFFNRHHQAGLPVRLLRLIRLKDRLDIVVIFSNIFLIQVSSTLLVSIIVIFAE